MARLNRAKLYKYFLNVMLERVVLEVVKMSGVKVIGKRMNLFARKIDEAKRNQT